MADYVAEFRRRPVLIAAACCLLLMLLVVLRTPTTVDEWWGFGVVSQIEQGDTFYSDVSYGSTPLAVILHLAAIQLPLPGLLAMRLLNALASVIVIVVTDWTLYTCGTKRLVRLAVVVLLVVFFVPDSLRQIYSALALAAAFAAVACVYLSSSRQAQLAAAGLAGLSFSTKYNTGAVAIAVVLAIALSRSSRPQRLWTMLSTLLAAAAAIIVVTVLPVVMKGDIGFFYQQVINKSSYIATGSISPLDGLRTSRDQFSNGLVWQLLAEPTFVFAAVAVAAIALAILCWRRWDGRWALVVGLFACSASLSIPRFDAPHAHLSMSAWALAIVAVPVLAFSQPRAQRMNNFWGIVFAVCSVCALAIGTLVIAPRHSTPTASADFHAWPLPDSVGATARADAAEIRTVAGDRVFLVSWYAPAAYASGGLQNPTRYNYPLASAFPTSAQQQVISQISTGSIPWVCIADIGGPLAPNVFINWVRANMKQVAVLNSCVLYSRR